MTALTGSLARRVGHSARGRRTGAQDITDLARHCAAELRGSRYAEQVTCERAAACKDGYVEPARRAGLPRAADQGAAGSMPAAPCTPRSQNARRSMKHGIALARRVRVGRRSPCTRRDRAAQDRRLKERRRSHHARRVNRLRSIASAAENAPLGKKRKRRGVCLLLSCCNCRARQGKTPPCTATSRRDHLLRRSSEHATTRR